MIDIIVVDDHHENLYFLENLLTSCGHNVRAVFNGAQALTIARESPPDLIISDILMPIMDGFVLCAEWRKDQNLSKIPFVFYTATYTEPKDEQFALDLGADRFILKPKDPDDFIEIIDDVIKNIINKNIDISKPKVNDQKIMMLEYNQTLIRKLEKKMVELEATNKIISETEIVREHILSKAKLGTFEWDSSNDIMKWSDTLYNIYGIAKDDYQINLQHVLVELAHDDDKEKVYTKFGFKEKDKESGEFEYKIIRPDGEIKYVVADKIIFNSNKYSPTKYIGFIHDITEKKIEEQKQLESDYQIKAFFNSTVIGTVDANIHGDLFNVNDEFLRITGYTREDFQKGILKWNEITPKEFLQKDYDGITEAKENGACTPYEKQYLRKNGERIWVLIGFILYGNTKENAVGFILDISNLKQKEEELERSNENLKVLSIHLNSIREKERTTYAMEIHEDLMKHLYALKTDTANYFKKNSNLTNTDNEQIINLINLTIESVRKIEEDISLFDFNKTKLKTILEDYVKEYSKLSQIPCDYDIEFHSKLLNNNDSLVIYRIIEESLAALSKLNNVGHIHIIVYESQKHLIIKISNDKSNSTKTIIEIKNYPELLSVKERVEQNGGEINFDFTDYQFSSINIKYLLKQK